MSQVPGQEQRTEESEGQVLQREQQVRELQNQPQEESEMSYSEESETSYSA